MTFPKFTTSFWILLTVGIAVRCVALNQPLLDAHPLRQCLTSVVTKSLMEQPGVPLTGKILWAGGLDHHFILELPFYNYLVIPVCELTGNLDLSGKLVTLALWICSFLLLQAIWRRLLEPGQVFWANLLFILAPLEVFWGQAFQPEMLVQVVAFGLVILILRHDENPTLARWAACVVIGIFALVLKMPETAHLYLILAFLLFRREGWKAMVRPAYLVGAGVTVAVLAASSTYIDSVNSAHVHEWTSKEMLATFLGPAGNRLHLKPWLMVAAYLGAFVVPGAAGVGAVYGLWTYLKNRGSPVLGVWLIGLALFYLVWFGNVGTVHSYYNLPTVAPLCALFGIGAAAFLNLERIARWRNTAGIAVALLVAVSVIPGLQYLFKQDTQILAASMAIRARTQPGDVVIYNLNHRWDMVDHTFNPVPAYCADRPTFVWNRTMPEEYRRASLDLGRYVVVTLPPPPAGGFIAAFNRFRGVEELKMESLDWVTDAGFQKVEETGEFIIYARK